MLQSLWKYFNGYVKIKVEGYASERFFNLCNVHQILLWEICKKQSCYDACISSKDFLRLRPLVRKTGTRITILEKRGFPSFFHRFRKRKIFFFGMIVCVITVYCLSLFVWNIHLEGNVTQSTEELLDYMESLGVYHGVRKSRIVCEDIETSLRKKYPNLLWVSAEMRGTRILVKIKENVDEDIIEKLPEKNTDPVSIKADISGIIRSMVVRQGTPTASVGDVVEEGQILVEGFYVIKNDAGEIKRYEPVAADADIWLYSEEAYTDVFSAEYEVKEYTGRKRLGIRCEIFSKSFDRQPGISFENFEVIEKKIKLHVTENFYLPFSFTMLWYVEYEPAAKLRDEEALKKFAEERFWKKQENNLQKGVQIIEKDVKIDTNGKLCHVTGTIKMLTPVTAKAPVKIPELNPIVSLEGDNQI